MKTVLVKVTFEESKRVLETLQAAQDCWNECSKIYFKKPEGGLKSIHDRCYRKVRKKVRKAPAQLVIKSEQAVLAAFRSIKSNKQELKKAPVKKKFSLQLDKRIYSLKADSISVTAVGGKRVAGKLLLYPRAVELMGLGFGDPNLIYRDGEFLLVFPCNTPTPICSDKSCIGVDLGLNCAVATSEGIFLTRTNFNKKLRRFSWNKRKLKSKGTKSARKHLRKASRRHGNMSKNFTHLCTNAVLSTSADVIVLESLSSIKHKNRGKHTNRRYGEWAIGEFRTILEYKAQALGKRVVTVNPAYTSKEDWRGIQAGERKGRRYYGSDGVVWDADWNAAMNIARRANIPISHRKVLDGQAQVTEPIAFKSSAHRESCKLSTLVGGG